MALGAAERETVISVTDADERIWIVSSQRPIVTKLRRNSSFELVDEKVHEGTTILSGWLPLNALTIRKPRAKSTSKVARKAPVIPRCGETKTDGSICQGFVIKGTGKCRHHPQSQKV